MHLHTKTYRSSRVKVSCGYRFNSFMVWVTPSVVNYKNQKINYLITILIKKKKV